MKRVHAAMEVVLLWLDDLDDLFFSTLAAGERLRQVILQVGLGAALALGAAEQSLLALPWSSASAASVAGASIGLWLTVLLGGRLSGAREALENAAA